MFRAPVEIASVVPRSGTKSSDTAGDREVEGCFSTTPEAKQLWALSSKLRSGAQRYSRNRFRSERASRCFEAFP